MLENREVLRQDEFQTRKEEIKRCPKCRSVYLTDKECEACGFQLNFDFVGEPFGHLSFYNAKDSFYKMGTIQRLLFFISGKKYKPYVKYELLLKRRLDNLLKYFFGHSDANENRKKFFFFELNQLVEEFGQLGLERYVSEQVKDFAISSDASNFSGNSAYVSRITSWIKHKTIKKKRMLSAPLSLKLFGSIRVGYVMVMMLMTLLFISIAIKMFPYFLA